jgi:hypothetical protein
MSLGVDDVLIVALACKRSDFAEGHKGQRLGVNHIIVISNASEPFGAS